MLELDSAGGIVFNHENEVLLIENARSEWVFPKGVISGGRSARQTALLSVEEECGLSCDVLGAAGQTAYEHFSLSRMRPVQNRIIWYALKTEDREISLAGQHNHRSAAFYPREDALERVTYSLDKSMLMLAYQVCSDDPDELA